VKIVPAKFSFAMRGSGVRGVGIDVANPARFDRILTGSRGPRLLERILTPSERLSLAKRAPQSRAQFVASRWACKEALVKACGASRKMFFNEVE
jgi:phosphopantetheine--protein transferase-like protein